PGEALGPLRPGRAGRSRRPLCSLRTPIAWAIRRAAIRVLRCVCRNVRAPEVRDRITRDVALEAAPKTPPGAGPGPPRAPRPLRPLCCQQTPIAWTKRRAAIRILRCVCRNVRAPEVRDRITRDVALEAVPKSLPGEALGPLRPLRPGRSGRSGCALRSGRAR